MKPSKLQQERKQFRSALDNFYIALDDSRILFQLASEAASLSQKVQLQGLAMEACARGLEISESVFAKAGNGDHASAKPRKKGRSSRESSEEAKGTCERRSLSPNSQTA